MLRNLGGDDRRLFSSQKKVNLASEAVSERNFKLETWDDRTKPPSQVLKTAFRVQNCCKLQ